MLNFLPPGAVAVILRHLLTFAGAILVNKGYVGAEQLDVIIGMIVTGIGVLWGGAHASGIKVEIKKEEPAASRTVPGTVVHNDPFDANK